MSNQSTQRRLATLLSSLTTRLDIYRKVRQAFRGVHALCAATASEYLIRAGVLGGYRPWTSQLESDLSRKGWKTVAAGVSPVDLQATEGSQSGERPRTTLHVGSNAQSSKLTGGVPAPPLRFGDLCYTIDSNRNGAPDHVFFFIRWLDRARLIAEVVDNYAPHPHPRNLGAPQWYGGKRLAYGKFHHAQRLP